MSAEKTDAGAAAPSGPKESKGPLLLALVNTLGVLAALGTLVYTRYVFKRPPITEAGERKRLLEAQNKAKHGQFNPGLMTFDTITINIKPSTTEMRYDPKAGSMTAAKPHFATIAFAIELRDISKQSKVEAFKPMLMDQILSMLGKKTFQELTNVQGRYVVRTQILDLVNELAQKQSSTQDVIATNIYFTNFMVQ